MKKLKLQSLSDLSMVFSTNPNAREETLNHDESSVLKRDQIIRVQLQRLKGGKLASRITGLEENLTTLESICKQIKQKCGVGGSAKLDEIIIQGDQVEKIIAILKGLGYPNTKRSGG